ncbi:hypothetical protein FIBSPDRAFT_872645 [Athelia psychrophila]|uniref:Uncharacterized protein n=1 Tax=Athelia psychrophila TaxID=1759441 RepID=A0A165Z8X3_9AGAM|nr:hypothetical protein FIBSPDRAFT_872645 [Fibularhizoctonia sp. CBS 109695]
MVEQRSEEPHLDADAAAACGPQRSKLQIFPLTSYANGVMLPIVPDGIPPSVYAATSAHS